MSRARKLARSPREQRPRIPLTVSAGAPRPGTIKIGAAARRLRVSPAAIRLYEDEGLLIALKSEAGTRWYREEDLEWMRRIQDLVAEGMNFAGIRRLLAQIPCWALKPCRAEDRAACSMRTEARSPCWIAPEKLCTEKLAECYDCSAYRRAREFTNLKVSAEIVPLVQVQ